MDLPQILEQNVEVMKEEAVSTIAFFSFESVWRGSCGQHGKSLLPHSLSHTRGRILNASDGIWNVLFSTYSRTSHWVGFSPMVVCLLSWFQASAICSNCLHRSPNCLLSLLIMCAAVSEEAASDVLVGTQPRIRCWACARSSSSELVDIATARRQQREEDATRVGLQFPFRQERRGRGAPSVAMKWRDAVKAAIMHGLLPPDLTHLAAF